MHERRRLGGRKGPGGAVEALGQRLPQVLIGDVPLQAGVVDSGLQPVDLVRVVVDRNLIPLRIAADVVVVGVGVHDHAVC